MPEAADGVSLTVCLRRLARVLLTETSLEALVGSLPAMVASSVGRVDAASAAVFTSGTGPEPAVLAASGGVEALERRQHEIGRGPAAQSVRTGSRFNAAVDGVHREWPEFATAATAAGLRSVLALPLRTQGRVFGALCAYSTAPAAFQLAEVEAGVQLADQAGVTVANAMALSEARDAISGLEERLARGSSIAKAQGILMVRHHCTSEQAFDRLRRTSQRENRRVRVIAEELVEAQERRAV